MCPLRGVTPSVSVKSTVFEFAGQDKSHKSAVIREQFGGGRFLQCLCAVMLAKKLLVNVGVDPTDTITLPGPDAGPLINQDQHGQICGQLDPLRPGGCVKYKLGLLVFEYTGAIQRGGERAPHRVFVIPQKVFLEHLRHHINPKSSQNGSFVVKRGKKTGLI